MSEEERTLWKSSPSQWLNLGPFALAIVVDLAVVVGSIFFLPAMVLSLFPIGYAVWKYLTVKCLVFELTNERLRVTSGVINQKVDEIELYRVKDSVLERQWWMRLTGLASLVLETSDRTMPRLTIPAIPDGESVREILRKQVEALRDSKRVREMDFDDVGDGGEFGDFEG
ncbi:MAG: PH domain-containing protein [Verrucomicrobiales bacterium]|nr:PH domain-containing protein [Verrucomicrobiota bacterium JB025]